MSKYSGMCPMSLAKLVRTIHIICKVRGSNLGHHPKKKYSGMFLLFFRIKEKEVLHNHKYLNTQSGYLHTKIHIF
jgi:hypothetical protein